MDTINSDNFSIYYRGREYPVAQYQAWIYEIDGEPRYEAGLAYEECRLVMKFRKEGWRRKILNGGLYELDNGDEPARPIQDANGDPAQQAALLSGTGVRLTAGASPIFLRWRFKDEKAFASVPFLGTPASP